VIASVSIVNVLASDSLFVMDMNSRPARVMVSLMSIPATKIKGLGFSSSVRFLSLAVVLSYFTIMCWAIRSPLSLEILFTLDIYILESTLVFRVIVFDPSVTITSVGVVFELRSIFLLEMLLVASFSCSCSLLRKIVSIKSGTVVKTIL